MGVRFKRWVIRVKIWWKKISSFMSGHRRIDRIFENHQKSLCMLLDILDREKNSRKSQATRMEKRIKERLEDMVVNINKRIDELEELTCSINESMSIKEKKLEIAWSGVSKKMTEAEGYIEKFKFVENLAEEASQSYERHLNNLRRDISEFEMTHQVTKRMASIEKRITLLEISHNGSGTDVSRPTGTHQD